MTADMTGLGETTPIPAPTPSEIMNALRIRDEVAFKIHRVNRSASRGEKVTVEHAKVCTEKLIELGYIDTAKVHAAIAEGDRDDDEDELDDGF